MKKPETKAKIRAEMQKLIDDYVRSGGEVEQIERGVSGRPLGSGPMRSERSLFDQKSEPRTFVPEVVAALDERANRKKETPPKRAAKPKRKAIYDDFGEIIRWEWQDE